jgi:hypothetical protein
MNKQEINYLLETILLLFDGITESELMLKLDLLPYIEKARKVKEFIEKL